MSFLATKKNILGKRDKSRKQEIDSAIRPIVTCINSINGLCTTSSCSGRIIVLTKPISCKKNECKWLFVSHNIISSNSLKMAIQTIPKEEVWFKFETFIIHIAAETLSIAGKVLAAANASGLRHSGIISLNKKYVIEVIGSEHVSTIIAKNRHLIVPESYIDILVGDANRKMKANRGKINRFHTELKKMLMKKGLMHKPYRKVKTNI